MFSRFDNIRVVDLSAENNKTGNWGKHKCMDERLISNQTKIEGSLQGEVRSYINLYDRSQILYNEQHSSVGYLSCCLYCLVFKTHSCSHGSSYSGEVLRQSKSEEETGHGSPLRLDRQENLSNTKVSTFKPQQRGS